MSFDYSSGGNKRSIIINDNPSKIQNTKLFDTGESSDDM